MSDTPRTDAGVVQMERLDGDIDEVVSAYFARTLERELIAARSATEEIAIGHARYKYIRTLNPRQFAELWDAALADERFDDLVDKRRNMKKEQSNQQGILDGSHHDAGEQPK